MKIFIFDFVEQLTDRYHSGGGLVVIANDLDEVKEMVAHDKSLQYTKITDEEYEKVIVYNLADDTSIHADAIHADVQKDFFIFPDAGCC